MTDLKKLISLGLAAVCLTLSVGCGEQAAGSAPAQSSDTASASAETSGAETTRASAAVDGKDYGGSSFDIYVSGYWSHDWTNSHDFSAESETGEPVNDAVFRRNTTIEDRYNVKISEVSDRGDSAGSFGAGKGYLTLSKLIMAGDSTYDAAMPGTYDAAQLSLLGYLLDLNSQVPYINLKNAWWDQRANEDLSLNGRMYFTTGDISTLDNDCTYCILFNKALIKNYSMDDPYAMVRNKSWTIDKFGEMVKQVSGDLNGDGKMDENDLYGLCIWQDSMDAMVNACGGRIADINSDGNVELTLNTDRNVTMLDKYMDFAFDKQYSYSITHSGDHIEVMFANDQVLFYTRYLCIVKKYRDMNTDFGIIPYPLFDESQDAYNTTIHSYGNSMICVPVTVPDAEMTGIILEDLACESMYTVTPAYYETALIGKYFRDDDSTEMLDILLSTRLYDIGATYLIADYYDKLVAMEQKYNKDFASMYAKNEAKALADVQKVNDAYAKFIN